MGFLTRRRRTIPLRITLLSTFLLVGLLPMAVSAQHSYSSARKALEQATFQKLAAIRDTRKRQIEDYFRQAEAHALFLAQTPTTRDAVLAFNDAVTEMNQTDSGASSAPLPEQVRLERYYREQLPLELSATTVNKVNSEAWLPTERAGILLQDAYIVRNPHPRAERGLLDSSGSLPAYDRVHERYHPDFRRFVQRFGFYDVLLVNTQGTESGEVVYSYTKEIDFGADILGNDEFRSSSVGIAYQASWLAQDPNSTKWMDFQFYVPSEGRPAAFVSVPIFDGSQKVGVLIVQLRIDEINRLMTGDGGWKAEGLGDTGETHLVGPDDTLRNDSRFFIESPTSHLALLAATGTDAETIERIRDNETTILLQRLGTALSASALRGETTQAIATDYRSETVLGATTRLDIRGLRWGLVAKIDSAEALAPLDLLRNQALLIGLVIAAVVALLSVLLARNIASPVLALTAATRRTSTGDLSARVSVASRNEIGELADAFNEMAENLQRTTVSTEYLDQILNSMKDALLVTSLPDDRVEKPIILAANPYALQRLGYSKDDLPGQPLDLVLLLPNEEIRASLEQTGLSTRRESALRTAAGELIPVQLSLSNTRDAAGGASNLVCVAHDISERKAAEEAMRQTNALELDLVERKAAEAVVATERERLQKILDTASVGVAMSIDGFVRFANPRCVELFGINVGDRTEDVFLRPEDRDHVLASINRYGTLRNYELQIRGNDGEPHDVLASFSVSEGGNRPGILAWIVDITERKQAEAALAIERARLQTILDTAPVDSWVRSKVNCAADAGTAASATTAVAASVMARQKAEFMGAPP